MVSSPTAVESQVAEGGWLESNRGLRLTLDALSIPIVMLDEHEIILGVNTAWSQFATADDLLVGRRSVGDRYSLPAEPAAPGSPSTEASAFARGLHAVMAGERNEFTLEYPCGHPQEPRWLLLRVSRFGDDGPARVIITHEDTTARKRAEEELSRSRETLRGILDHIPQRVFWKDRNSVYLGCNRPFAVDEGFNEPDELVGKTDYEIYSRPVAERCRGDDRSVMEADVAKTGYEEPGATGDGRPAWLRTNKIPLHDRQGQVIGILGTYEDITEHKLAKLEIERLNADLEQRVAQRTEALFAATREAERANRAKSEFLSRTSHELRTPLNAILGFGQLLEMDAPAPRQEESVTHILRAGRHLLGLIDEVLDLAHVESGRFEVHLETVDLEAVVHESLALMAPLAARRQVTLEPIQVAARAGAGPQVRADRRRLQQVLFNLLGNAIKYNAVGGRVRLGHVPVGTDHLRLRVADTGPGLNAAQRARLFIPFERLGAEYGEVEGSGLGLSLARALMAAMGGELGLEETPAAAVEAASAVKLGAVFWLELPLADSSG